MSERDDEWRRLLDIAVWGFEGEPQRCSRCNAERYAGAHSETCPMPAEVIVPANKLLDRLSHGRVTDRRWDMRLRANRERSGE